MLFNSLHFLYFFPIVFFLYWFLQSKKIVYQNLLLLISSYYFYACWDWRFLFLLIFSTALDFFTGLQISKSSTKTKKIIWLWISIIINLGFLGFFKYYNFFIESFVDLMNNLGVTLNPWTLKIILPVGISFYTFHGLSYVLDIYYERIKPETNQIDYSVFVSFFPLLVAGPIERATHLLPQIKKKRVFDYSKALNGSKQILWGLFKKIVIADNCAEYANYIFDNSSHLSGSVLILGAFFFAIQIYCDFSGYSDIALGTARLLGIELLRNFAFPYFSRDIAEFWRRWHISLSTWFRDYLYIPLGGSKGNWFNKIRNTFIIFIVSGFWHGANWTFIFWGFLNALYFVPLLIFNKNRNHIEIVAKGKILPGFNDFLKIISTFSLTLLAWVFFRANNLNHAFQMISEIFSFSTFSLPYYLGIGKSIPILILTIFFLIIEWLGRDEQFAISNFGIKWPKFFRWCFYYLIIILIVYWSGNEQEFIYFQF